MEFHRSVFPGVFLCGVSLLLSSCSITSDFVSSVWVKKKKTTQKNEVVQIRLVGNNAVSARPSSSPPPPYCWLGSMRDPGRLAKPLFLINCH